MIRVARPGGCVSSTSFYCILYPLSRGHTAREAHGKDRGNLALPNIHPINRSTVPHPLAAYRKKNGALLCTNDAQKGKTK